MRTTAKIQALLVVSALSTGAVALAQATLPPLRIVSKAEPVTFLENGATRTYYRIAPGKPIELGTTGEMALMVPVRALADAQSAGLVPSVTVEVIAPGVAPVVYKDVLSTNGPAVAVSNGMQGLAPKVLRIPITLPAATVRISVDVAPGAIVGFARSPLATIAPAPTPVAVAPTPTPRPLASPTPTSGRPVSTPAPTPIAVAAATPQPSLADPALDAMSLAIVPLPLIRRRVERLGLGPRVGYVIPTGAVDAGADPSSNLYAGAELRFTPSLLDRHLGVTLEAGTYKLVDTEPLNTTSPFGISTASDVKISIQVVPLLGGMVWRQRLGSSDKQALFLGANGGAVLTTRTEEVEFRDATRSSETRFGAQGRVGYDRKIGPGRTVLEASYLHVTPGKDELNDTYVGGAFVGLQYRFVF